MFEYGRKSGEERQKIVVIDRGVVMSFEEMHLSLDKVYKEQWFFGFIIGKFISKLAEP